MIKLIAKKNVCARCYSYISQCCCHHWCQKFTCSKIFLLPCYFVFFDSVGAAYFAINTPHKQHNMHLVKSIVRMLQIRRENLSENSEDKISVCISICMLNLSRSLNQWWPIKKLISGKREKLSICSISKDNFKNVYNRIVTTTVSYAWVILFRQTNTHTLTLKCIHMWKHYNDILISHVLKSQCSRRIPTSDTLWKLSLQF